MIKIILISFCVFNFSLATFSNINKEWNDYKIKFQKDYNVFEDIYRRTIWYTNRNLINFHNSRSNQNSITYKLAINQFSDMTQTEFSRIFQRNPKNIINRLSKLNDKFLKQIPSTINNSTIPSSLPPPSPPNSIDWRNKGAVSYSIKNQGRICSTGWAFATLEALESHHFLRFGSLPPQLSAQNLIDCVQSQLQDQFLPFSSEIIVSKNIQNFQNFVCNRQTPNDALEYIIENQNVNTEFSYPYEKGKQGICRYNPNNIGATCAAIRYLPEERDDYLLQIVGNIGPVIVGYDPTNFNFMHYASGIYDEPLPLLSFIKNPLNHFLLIVGYGNDSLYGNFWIAKNSFGETWGENGYIRISRKTTRPISKFAIYPIV